MPGIVRSLFAGMDDSRERRRQAMADRVAAEELEYRRGRRGIEDQRAELEFAQKQEDRARNISERGEDRAYLLNVERPAAQRRTEREERVGAFNESRLPVQAQREDAKFAWQMSREKRDAHLDGIRAQLAEYGLDDARLQQEVKMAQRAFLPAVAAFSRSRDPRVFAEWANQTVAKNDPVTIERGDDGDWYMYTQSGDRQNLGTAENVMQVARSLTHPDVFLEMQASQIKRQQELADKEAQNPQRFTELVNDENGNLLVVDTRTGQARPVMDGGGILRATKAGAFGSRAGELTTGVRKPTENSAREPVFIAPPRGKPTDEMRARASQLQAARQQPTRQAPAQRTVVRTGRGPDGRRVAQYSDGTVEYIQ